MSLKDKYAIVGVGYTPQGRVPDRTTLSFHVEASVNAIKDAGLKREDIDGLISYRHLPAAIGEPDMTPYLLAQHLGITPKVMSQEANCARSQVLNALGWLDAGLCNYVVISYAHNALSGGRFFGQGIDNYNSAVFGHFGATAGYAMAAQRAMHTFGTGPETWKHIAVGQRKWANLNPSAMMHDRPMSFDDYYDSQRVVEPLRLFDNCLITDGGRACVITSVDRARDLRNPPAVIMGIGQHNPSCEIDQATTMAGPTGAKISGEQAFEMAGITMDDIDACEIYDCFTYTVEVTLQDYGFFQTGEGEDWLKDGTIEPGGRMPVNTSGGQLSEAYYMGLTQLTEAAMQLMGRCDERQLGPKTKTKVPGIILCSDNGAILQTHATIILRRL
ncbi:MAG: thiolase family protein [Desulfobacteraceae bacterium]|nr:thiolase family protein [Desulfobacteraceae bacterium]